MSFKGIGVRIPVIVVALCVSIWSLSTLIIPSVPEAGLYHAQGDAYNNNIDSIACAQCHTMHGVQGGTSSSLIYGGEITTYPALLRKATALELCLYCHDGNNASLTNPIPPDVTGDIAAGQSVPSAGNFAHGNYTNDNNRHNLGGDVSATLPPGYEGAAAGWSSVTGKHGTTFNCLYCHDNHGNTNYRNLRYNPGYPANDDRTDPARVDITYGYGGAAGGGATTTDVYNWSANTTSGTPAEKISKYERDQVSFRRKPIDGEGRGMSAWCGKCHETFYGISGGANMGGAAGGGEGPGDTGTSPWIRHPVGDAVIEQGVAGTNQHTDSTDFAAGDIGVVRIVDAQLTSTIGGDEQPLCLSCHYAHGGGNPNRPALGGDDTLDHSNLVFLDASGDVNIDDAAYDASTGTLRNLCQKCHNQ